MVYVFEGADNWKVYWWLDPKEWRPINPTTEESFVITINFCLPWMVNIKSQICMLCFILKKCQLKTESPDADRKEDHMRMMQ